MAEEPNQVKRHIDATRRELSENVEELGNRLKRATDWHTYVDKSPLTMLGLAFAGGVVLSSVVGRSGNHHNGRAHALAAAPDAQRHRGVEYGKNEAADMLDNVKGAIIGWAANQFKTWLSEMVPGFRQEYERTESEKKAQRQSPAHQLG